MAPDGTRGGSRQWHLLCLFSQAVYHAANLSNKLLVARAKKLGQGTINSRGCSQCNKLRIGSKKLGMTEYALAFW